MMLHALLFAWHSYTFPTFTAEKSQLPRHFLDHCISSTKPLSVGDRSGVGVCGKWDMNIEIPSRVSVLWE